MLCTCEEFEKKIDHAVLFAQDVTYIAKKNIIFVSLCNDKKEAGVAAHVVQYPAVNSEVENL